MRSSACVSGPSAPSAGRAEIIARMMSRAVGVLAGIRASGKGTPRKLTAYVPGGNSA